MQELLIENMKLHLNVNQLIRKYKIKQMIKKVKMLKKRNDIFLFFVLYYKYFQKKVYSFFNFYLLNNININFILQYIKQWFILLLF